MNNHFAPYDGISVSKFELFELKLELKNEITMEIKQFLELNPPPQFFNPLQKFNEEVKFEVRRDIQGTIKEEIKREVKHELKDEFKHDITWQLRSELKPIIKNELKYELKEELKREVKDELENEFKPFLKIVIKKDIQTEMAVEIEKIQDELQNYSCFRFFYFLYTNLKMKTKTD